MSLKKGTDIKEKITSIKKSNFKTLSKKKQRSLTKSAKVMIQKMNDHTTDDDIFNIVKSLETNTDTKNTDGEASSKTENQKQGLESLKKDQLQNDVERDLATAAKQKKTQTEIAQQLELIESICL